MLKQSVLKLCSLQDLGQLFTAGVQDSASATLKGLANPCSWLVSYIMSYLSLLSRFLTVSSYTTISYRLCMHL